jgi:DNA-binding NtrC family response regulator
MSAAVQPASRDATTRPAPCVLIADDQPHILAALDLLLEPEGYRVEKASSPLMVLDALASGSFDALLLDLNYTRDTTSGREGLDLLAQIRSHESQLPVIVMTAWANVELAVEAMRRGASDFIQKPWDNARLLTILRTQIDLFHAVHRAQRLEAENRLLRAEGLPTMIATAPAMQPVLATIARIGPSEAAVLITGEHGTGKEVVAQTLHALSSRASRSMVALNTGALPEGTFESELFGHVKGAFTDARTERIGRFELAEGGTLFLDEIANVPPRQQARLLRVLETGEMADLHKEVEEGRFRADLLFRLNTVEIHLPPLRDRREDIPPLAAHFLARYAQRYRKQAQGIDPAALQIMLQYAWPGNVRELDHTMERAVLMAHSEFIESADLGLSPAARPSAQSLEEMSLESVESILIRKALSRAGGNVSQAAEALGLSRGALYRRMEKYGI